MRAINPDYARDLRVNPEMHRACLLSPFQGARERVPPTSHDHLDNLGGSSATMFDILAAASLASISTALVLILVAHKILRNRWLLAKYKKLSNGLPIHDDFSSLSTHSTSVMLARGNCQMAQRAHEKWGPYVGYLVGEKFCVSTIDLDLIKRVAIDEAHLHLDRMSLNLPFTEYEQSIMLAPGDKWRPMRRVFAPALRPSKFKMPNVVQEIEQSIGKLVNHIESRLDSRSSGRTGAIEKRKELKLEVDEIAHRYSLNLVFSCFYKQYKQVDFDAIVCAWTRSIDEMLHDFRASIALRLAQIFPWIRRPLDWLTWNFHKHGQTRRKILEFVKLQTRLGIEVRKSGGEQQADNSLLLRDGTLYRRNIVDYIIDAFLDGKLSQADYFNSSCFLFLAADKTASDCIVHTIYLLSIYPQVQEQLRSSVKLDGADSEYLNWVLHESLRLLPPVPVGCSRSVSCSIELGTGYVIPANTFLMTNAYVIHRLKKYWGDDAEEFKPERWADTSHHHPMQFLAFGAGSRACLGREFALFEMKLLFAALLTRYKFQGTPRADAYDVTSPAMIFMAPSSTTCVTISRLDNGEL